MSKTEYAQPFTAASYEAARAYGAGQITPRRVMSAARSPSVPRNSSAARSPSAARSSSAPRNTPSARSPFAPPQQPQKRTDNKQPPQRQEQNPRQNRTGRDAEYFTRDSRFNTPSERRRAARTVSDLDTTRFTRPSGAAYTGAANASNRQQDRVQQQSREPRQNRPAEQSRMPPQNRPVQQNLSAQQSYAPRPDRQPKQNNTPLMNHTPQQSYAPRPDRQPKQNNAPRMNHTPQANRPQQQNRVQQTARNGFVRRERAPGERPVNRRKPSPGASMNRATPEKTTFERARQKKIRSKAFRAVSAALMLAVLTVTAFAVIYETLFGIESITVTGLTKYKESVVIEASGLSPGDKLWSFSASRTEAAITLACPYIKSVKVRRIIPNAVVLGVSEDSALYYADILGERFILNADCKVLALTSTDTMPSGGLIKLKLPEVRRAIAGRALVYKESWPEKYVSECLAAASSSGLFDRLNMIDLRNRSNLVMTSDSKYLLILGTVENADIKLLTAEKILEDELFSTDNKASIDLTNIKESSVIIDNQLDLS